MRIISGKAKRIPLAAPKGKNTRPTSDRAKEGLFNIIVTRVADSSFLDLFCGSGAIGIEALSRGAKRAAFVDHSPIAITALKTNLEKARFGQQAFYLCVKASMAIEKFSKENSRFDIIFLDPPYDENLVADTLHHIVQARILAEGGIIVAETDTKKIDNFPSSLYLYDCRAYGMTNFLFFEMGAKK